MRFSSDDVAYAVVMWQKDDEVAKETFDKNDGNGIWAIFCPSHGHVS